MLQTYYGLQLAMDERNLTVKELQENNGYITLDRWKWQEKFQ